MSPVPEAATLGASGSMLPHFLSASVSEPREEIDPIRIEVFYHGKKVVSQNNFERICSDKQIAPYSITEPLDPLTVEVKFSSLYYSFVVRCTRTFLHENYGEE